MPEHKLREHYQSIQAELVEVQRTISDQLNTADEQIAPVLRVISQRQGKMLRPAMVLLSGKLYSDIYPEHMTFAAMVELIHMASLLHDDVIDKADMRRGQPSANALWGNTSAVLLGDLLLSRAFMLAGASTCEGVVTLLGQMAQTLCTGELQQNLLKGCHDLTERDYFQMIEAKTAALFDCSCRLGAMASGAPEDQQKRAGQFGCHFGLAFQIVDDLRDILSDEEAEGKTLGTDLRHRKFTLPIIHWYSQNGDRKKAFAEQSEIFSDPVELTRQLRASGSIDYAIEQATLQIQQAKEAIEPLPRTSAKEALCRIADTAIEKIS